MFNIFVKYLNKMNNKNSSVLNLNSFMIVSTFFLLWLAVQFEESVENIFAYVLILSFGILHGANDLKLIQHSESFEVSGKSFLKTLFYYVIFVLGSALLFYFIPAIALFLFVICSGYHFGEQHWTAQIKEYSIVSRLFFLAYGLFILCLLFYIHAETVSTIIENIIEGTIWEGTYAYLTIFSGALTVVLFLFLALKNKNLQTSFIKELFYITVFIVVFRTASLLWSFAIYFVLWHSIPSLVDQINYLYGPLSKGTIKSYMKASFPYWMISIIGLSVVLYILRDDFETSLSFFFSFLAAITFPHVLVINRINNS